MYNKEYSPAVMAMFLLAFVGYVVFFFIKNTTYMSLYASFVLTPVYLIIASGLDYSLSSFTPFESNIFDFILVLAPVGMILYLFFVLHGYSPELIDFVVFAPVLIPTILYFLILYIPGEISKIRKTLYEYQSY